MNTRSSHILIPAPPDVVRQILLEPTELADWNSAFLTIQGPKHAIVGERYPIVVRGGLRGHWAYRQITDELIEGRWDVPGLTEENSWQLRPHGSGTHVTHALQQRGALASVLRSATVNVAELRLERLYKRAEARVLAGTS
ncbi:MULTISPECIES: SRPBCC family protein [Streptomyces]|uniref:SRPBCC family protein n=1 Tax=Streptomyces dengpaensis TaxID=2049881 RepID=A0ABN5I2A9_9ACTN|nr:MULTISPECIES: SRPBCC family protein [Streptomyces]AVH55802.1 hypothetical protein C4B68_08500 [Streptomyces dengpaensis]PIB12057.1 hypothetical protein B1C81_02435 [Streptomyces sp. HG99]